ncbi:MAG: hypothetical protein ACI4P4_09340 [Faecousia sp.]
MNGEMKKEQVSAVRSFRVTDDVMMRFNAIKEELKLNQDGALAQLINVYELEQAKSVFPDRKTEIANFQTKAQELVNAYLTSLQLNADAELRVRSEVALTIERMEKTIAAYQETVAREQEKTAALEREVAQAEASAAEHAQLRVELGKAMRMLEETKSRYERQLRDKEDISAMLHTRLEEAEEKAAAYEDLMRSRDTLSNELRAAQEAQNRLQRDFKLQATENAYAAERAKEEAVAAVKAEAANRIDLLKEQLQEARLKAEQDLRKSDNEKNAEILKLEHDFRKQMQDLRALEQENVQLREQMSGLLKEKDTE